MHRQRQGQRALRIRCEASIVTTNARAPGGQFVLHARTLPGNPYDGHTLGAVIEATERLTGREIERAYVDKGYRGHHAPNPRRVFISGQKRGVFGRIKRELTRRSAIEAVIGHMKAEGHLGRCYLKGRAGDAVNVILSAVGYNLRLMDHFAPRATPDLHNSASPQTGFFTGDAISMHDGGHTLRRGRMSKSASKVARTTQMLRRIVRNSGAKALGAASRSSNAICLQGWSVAFTGPGPSAPLAGIGGMSPSPAGSSKRGDYP